MSAVYVHNLTVYSGTDFVQEYDMYEVGNRVVDLTNYSARAQLRKHIGSGTSVSFTVGFPDRKNGKIKLSIPSWQTSRLKSGRYVYDILFTKPSGAQDIVLEGSVNVRTGISTSCFGGSAGLPTSAQRLCIAVIDESDAQTQSGMRDKWSQFRGTYPNRTFYLLMPRNDGFGHLVDKKEYNLIMMPQNFANETTVNTGRLISEDGD